MNTEGTAGRLARFALVVMPTVVLLLIVLNWSLYRAPPAEAVLRVNRLSASAAVFEGIPVSEESRSSYVRTLDIATAHGALRVPIASPMTLTPFPVHPSDAIKALPVRPAVWRNAEEFPWINLGRPPMEDLDPEVEARRYATYRAKERFRLDVFKAIRSYQRTLVVADAGLPAWRTLLTLGLDRWAPRSLAVRSSTGLIQEHLVASVGSHYRHGEEHMEFVLLPHAVHIRSTRYSLDPKRFGCLVPHGPDDEVDTSTVEAVIRAGLSASARRWPQRVWVTGETVTTAQLVRLFDAMARAGLREIDPGAWLPGHGNVALRLSNGGAEDPRSPRSMAEMPDCLSLLPREQPTEPSAHSDASKAPHASQFAALSDWEVRDLSRWHGGWIAECEGPARRAIAERRWALVNSEGLSARWLGLGENEQIVDVVTTSSGRAWALSVSPQGFALWSGRGGPWERHPVASDAGLATDEELKLYAASDELVVVGTAQQLWIHTVWNKAWRRIELPPLSGLQGMPDHGVLHGGFLYLGYDRGEWGGGLALFDLRAKRWAHTPEGVGEPGSAALPVADIASGPAEGVWVVSGIAHLNRRAGSLVARSFHGWSIEAVSSWQGDEPTRDGEMDPRTRVVAPVSFSDVDFDSKGRAVLLSPRRGPLRQSKKGWEPIAARWPSFDYKDRHMGLVFDGLARTFAMVNDEEVLVGSRTFGLVRIHLGTGEGWDVPIGEAGDRYRGPGAETGGR